MSTEGKIPMRFMGPVSEAVFCLEGEDCPRSGFNYVLFKGRPDIEAMKEALKRTQEAFPVSISRLAEKKIGLRYRLVRVPLEEPPPLQIMENYAHDLRGLTHMEALTELFEPDFLKTMNLFEEPPSRCCLVRFPDDEHALVFYFNHVGSDAANMMAMIRTFFSAYHELVKGQPPSWAEAEDMPSSHGRQTARHSTFRVLRDMMAESHRRKIHPLIRFGNNAGITNAKRHVVLFRLDRRETLEAVQKAKGTGMSFNDFLCVGVVKAIDEMIEMPPGTQSIWIPVNVRANTSGHQGRANHSTSINIDLQRDVRCDDRRLFQYFVERRKQILAMGRDVVALQLLDKLLWAASFFPVRMRRPVLHKIFALTGTFEVSNVGVLWPRRENGRITTESVLTHAGDLEIIHYSMNFAPEDSIGHGLVAYTYLGQFNANFSVYHQIMERDQAEHLMKLVRRWLVS